MTESASTALIVGVSGQDGTLLSQDLKRQGMQVIGISRSALSLPDSSQDVQIHNFSILNPSSVDELILEHRPQEVYYLPAYHGSAEGNYTDLALESYQKHADVHVYGLLNFLTAIRVHSPRTRLFYASSSLVFDGSVGPMQNETTPFSPVGYYGLTKVQGMLLCREYRNRHDVFASCGILYNHESALRSASFLSKKLISGAHRISQGLQSEIVVGNLEAETDWGYAPDYVEAFQRVLRVDEADDFVIASGESHSVREFSEIVFGCFSLNADKYLKQDNELIGRKTVAKIGDIERTRVKTGWKPKRSFRQMVEQLVEDYLASDGSNSER